MGILNSLPRLIDLLEPRVIFPGYLAGVGVWAAATGKEGKRRGSPGWRGDSEGGGSGERG
jgi:hypothetical protein